MQKILIVVDMQNDFIDGALGTPEAVAIVQRVEQKIREFPGKVIFTRDTHEECYLETQEGKHLPVPHCIKGTKGWEICPQLEALREAEAIDKVTFGSEKLGELLQLCTFIESIFAGDTDYRGCILLCRGNAEKPRDSARRNAHVPDQHRKIKVRACAGST